MDVLYIKPYEGEVEVLEAQLPEVTVHAADNVEAIDPTILNQIEILSVFVDYPVSLAIIQTLPRLRLIAARSAGYDHIDLKAAAARGISACRVPHYGTRIVAEYTFALIFALARKVHQANLDMQNDPTIHAFEHYEGFDLFGKTIGVVGTGAIGRSVCTIGRGIGMEVRAFDMYPDEAWAESLGVKYLSSEAVLSQADIVSLHVPSTPETRHFLNSDRINTMKRGSYLVNTSRGEIVDTAALVAALQNKHLAGAALDVLEGETALRDEVRLINDQATDHQLWKTLVADHALIDMPNVIVTPHIAFNTKEAKREITEVTIANIRAFLSKVPQNVI